jgi:hypothetical protein
MAITISGSNDNISAADGSLTIQGLTFNATGINVTGFVTATTFIGDGSGLTGVAATDNIITDTLAQFNGGVGVADSIFHVGDTNTAIRFPAADTFTVETSGSERLRIHSSGFVGIGTDIPNSYDSGARTLVLDQNGTLAGMTIRASNQGSIYFADGLTGNEAYRGRIEYSHTNDSLNFGTAGTGSKVTITSTGGVHFNNAEFIERVNITAGKLSDNLQVSLDNGMVHYFTTTESTTSIPNIVSSAGINTSMATGDTMALTIVLDGAAAGYSTRISIDGTLAGITTYWSGGAAPTEGASGKDVYAYQIVKTGDAAYDVLASYSNFA